MISTTRIQRQSAIRLFAQEFSESNLTEQGIGEYDPSFVITKLGVKVNRALFCGVIDRLEKERRRQWSKFQWPNKRSNWYQPF